MKILHIFWCLSCLYLCASTWKYQSKLSSVLSSVLPPKLTDFSTAYNNNLNQLIIYGGISNGQYSNTTYIFNLTDNSVTKLVQNLSEIRFKACILAIRNRLYLFGGYKVDTVKQVDSGEFWQLDLVTFEWRITKSELQPYRLCKMTYDNETILIFGASFDGVLDVFTYSPSTKQFQNVSIVFFGLCHYSATQWDGSSVDLTIPIEDCPQQQTQKIILTSSFSTEQMQYLELMDAGVTTKHVLQTKDETYYYIYFPNTSSIQIHHFSGMDKQQGRLISKSIKYTGLYTGWNIFCNWNVQLQQFYVTFVQRDMITQLRVTNETPNFYSEQWPNFNNSLNDFCLMLVQHTNNNNVTDIAMMVLIHGSLKVYSLHQNVFQGEQRPPGLLRSLFGLNQCRPGWTGSNCTVPACPNSLIINGANNISVIRFECSGHGKCNASGCICDSLWEGKDCSIYKRKSCEGKLQENFPLKNCECYNSTVGGNDCSVVFCPGNCFGHGKCNNGVCECDQNFYGADCGTMVVPFPK